MTLQKALDTYCPGCQEQRPSDHDFCYRCGDRLKRGEPCYRCAKFVEPDTLDDDDLCPECVEKRRQREW